MNPFPGTLDASPESQIIFSSLRRSDFSASPTVTGSASGPHAGHLVGLPDGAGTAFAPARPFTAGETVRVDASLTTSQAGTASGDPGARTLRFSFRVAAPVAGASRNVAGPAAASAPHSASAGPGPTYHSAPGLHPPQVHVSAGPAPGNGDIFLSPSGAPRGMMILNPRGQLIWFHPLTMGYPANLEVQRYRGQPVLTWWQGVVQGGGGASGQDVIVNNSYHPVATVRPGWGYAADQHEFQITPQGTALVDAYVPVRANLSSLGGSQDAGLIDCIVQAVDIRTGTVLWDWHAWGHVPLRSSYTRPSPTSGSFDPFHLNSIQQLAHHRLLISFRNTWAVYEIDELTGRVIWTLGGKYSSFSIQRGARFEWQHDAHLYPHGLLTVFDDADAPQEEPQSSAKELRVDLPAHRVTLVHKYGHSPPLLASSQGSAELLGDGHMFVGWGSAPEFSEYTAAGREVFDASFALTNASYRAYRFPWTGHPLSRPALALARSHKGITWMYVSWNGATQVARWQVLGGPGSKKLKPLKTRRWSGFETAIAIPSAPHYLAVQALDASGHVLGRSRIMTRPAS
ncbi:MAG TPA: arylsulfotransferase family protein [Solirubrobacteraceae bacterium]|nr:arylsulfotransferase family protein [Solirubrobacteraceae bacterium]